MMAKAMAMAMKVAQRRCEVSVITTPQTSRAPANTNTRPIFVILMDFRIPCRITF